MSDLLARLKAGRAAIRRVKLGDVELGLRILTEQDYLEAGIATAAAMRQAHLEVNLGTADTWEQEKASQLLARALVDPDTGRPVAPGAKGLREAVTREQREFLIGEYIAHEREFSPTSGVLSDDEFGRLLEEVKKTPATTSLDDSSFATLKRLVRFLADPQRI